MLNEWINKWISDAYNDHKRCTDFFASLLRIKSENGILKLENNPNLFTLNAFFDSGYFCWFKIRKAIYCVIFKAHS